MSLLTTPYWHEQVQAPVVTDKPLPDSADVVIVGSGYTGLNAALPLLRAGKSVVILDSEAVGWGCSTRNGGQVGTGMKPDIKTLSRKYGQQRAVAILREGHHARAWIGRFLKQEQLACDFEVCGSFHAAHNRSAFKHLCHEAVNQIAGLEEDIRIVQPQEQHEVLGTDVYHGGVVYTGYASLHPARYHAALVQRVTTTGASIISYCRALNLEKQGRAFRVETQRGAIRCNQVLIATNGYSGELLPWLKRRVIPIGSYVIATDEIPESLMQQLMPRNHIVSDTRKVIYYYRTSPDRRRILFGGRVAAGEISAQRSAPLLKRDLDALFPQLSRVKVTHSWSGLVAYTFDALPHLGCHDGIYYAMGYCGEGVAMSGYLGMKIGQQMLGLEEGRTAFDGLDFQTRPLYYGKPWFLAPTVHYYRWRDSLSF